MTNKYTIDRNEKDGVVSICLCDDDCDYLGSFLDVWTDNDDNPSPFENMDTATQFCEIIIKLLEAIS